MSHYDMKEGKVRSWVIAKQGSRQPLQYPTSQSLERNSYRLRQWGAVVPIPGRYFLENSSRESQKVNITKQQTPKLLTITGGGAACLEILIPELHPNPTGSDSLAWAWKLQYLISSPVSATVCKLEYSSCHYCLIFLSFHLVCPQYSCQIKYRTSS